MTTETHGAHERRIELDFLRGVAILLVLGAHYTFPLTGVPAVDWIGTTAYAVGPVGVDLFFTLSGFLVGGLLMKQYRDEGRVDAGRFLTRRAFKIWPALYVLVFFHLALGRHKPEAFFWQNMLHVQNYFGTSLAHTWSLAVEEHFYLVLAGLLWAMSKAKPRTIVAVLVGLIVASAAARLWIVSTGDLDAAFRQTQYRMENLLYGVLLAASYYLYPQLYARIARQRGALIASAVGLVLWIYFTAPHREIVRSVGYTVQGIGFAFLLVLFLEHASKLRAHAFGRVVAWVGLYSYGIYLWHTIAQEPGRKATGWLLAHGLSGLAAWPIVVAGQCAVGICLGFAMTKLVEWPFLRVRDRFFPAERSKDPVPFTAVAAKA